MKVGLIKDKSKEYDGYNWHDEYAFYLNENKIDFDFIDFDIDSWQVKLSKYDYKFLLWRAWHVPWDRDNAKRKIFFIENTLKKQIYPTWEMYWSYDDKISQLYLLNHYSLPHPKTFITHSKIEALKNAEDITFPIVSKAFEGAMGNNVRLFNTKDELINHLYEVFTPIGIPTKFAGRNQQNYIYIQEYIPCKRDLRIITIGDKVELAFWRESKDWIKNISNGGILNSKNIPDDAIQLALHASKKLGMHWCAFDIIENKGKYEILEFSSVFGFSSGQYENIFHHKNAFILKKQIEYLLKIISL